MLVSYYISPFVSLDSCDILFLLLRYVSARHFPDSTWQPLPSIIIIIAFEGVNSHGRSEWLAHWNMSSHSSYSIIIIA